MSVIYLNYDARGKYDAEVKQSIASEYIYEVNRLGISAAINEGMRYWFQYNDAEYVFICANDILLPREWKETLLNAYRNIPNTGMIAIYCVENLPPEEIINGIKIHPCWGVFGDCLISREAWQRIGYWNLDQDPYGMNDSDYCYRLHKAGFLNYYIGGLRADHLGHDVGSGDSYRAMKDQGLNKAVGIFNQYQAMYDDGHLYLPYDQTEHYTIFQKESL